MNQNLKRIISAIILTFMSFQRVYSGESFDDMDETEKANITSNSALEIRRKRLRQEISGNSEEHPKIKFTDIPGCVMHKILFIASDSQYFRKKVLQASYNVSFKLICTDWELVCKDWQKMTYHVENKSGFLVNILISAYNQLKSKETVNYGEICKDFLSGKLV